ncbi:MAG: nuclear transport factor 2 family protein [Thermoleophilia bacterium]
MSEELLLTAYERGWNAHDPDVCAGCFTRDAVRRSLLRDAPATEGRTAIREGIALAMDALPDLTVEVLAVGYASDRRLWAEWRVTGTPAAGGVPLDVPGVSVFRFSNAGFVEERLYWDSAFAR